MFTNFTHNTISQSSCFISGLSTAVASFYINCCYFYIRLQQQSIERAMDLTDSFTWEDLPTRDADTGHLTAAGWIPLIKTYTMRAAIMMTVFHTVQSSIRIVTNHETLYIAWYPFDWTVSPFYELVIISQVKITIYKNYIVPKKDILLS